MVYSKIPFKSYCWCLGTTSFRSKQFNRKIELQLELLKEFFEKEENKKTSWDGNNELQIKYYNFLQEREFVTGNDSNPSKAAREKTSGLCEFGLIDESRHLSEAGMKLLNISKKGEFNKSNILKIANDSYIFTKQLLKASNSQVDNNVVKPYLILIYLLSKLEYLTMNEFTYLLPLCINNETTMDILEKINQLRNNKTTIDNIILNTVLQLPNYQQAKSLFLKNNVDEELICTIGMNRKSRSYDKVYHPFYKKLKEICVDKNLSKLYDLYCLTDTLKLKTYWRKFLFENTSNRQLKNNPKSCVSNAHIYKIQNELDFKEQFFNYMHLFKIKANLYDYSDLNERYFKTTDTIIFNDNIVKFDIIPKYFFGRISDELYNEAFLKNDRLPDDCEINEISECIDVDADALYSEIQKALGIDVSNEKDIQKFISDERHIRFKKIIETKYPNEKLIDLLSYFEDRINDNKIYEWVTENADIPTIFEYILGIIWYKISDYRGQVLDFMNLSLDADLLPKSHACGGEADIVYKYAETSDYPKHDMLIEATLMDKSAQRRCEMEPVSRHLGTNILNTKNNNSYCIFISPYLDINVLNHFRSLKISGYYNPKDYNQHVSSLKIIPIKTKELKTILTKNIKYADLYKKFDNAHNFDSALPTWYESELVTNL